MMETFQVSLRKTNRIWLNFPHISMIGFDSYIIDNLVDLCLKGLIRDFY